MSSFVCSSYYNNQRFKFMSSISKLGSGADAKHGRHTSSTSTRSSSSSSPLYMLHKNDEQYLKAGLRKDLMPNHVSIILDGNRRWHKDQGRPLDYGPFFQANTLFADLCLEWGVGVASTFVYSIDNLQRGKEANDLMFGQLERFLRDNMENFTRKKVRVSIIGERSVVSKSLQEMMKEVENETRKETKVRLEVMLAVCYAGRRDIVEATRRLCEKAKAGLIEPNAVDEALFDHELLTCGAPPPDLIIRTGGNLRLSNYLMWQSAHTELYFTDIHGPEFTEVEFLQALRSFQQRDRTTFGK